MTFLFLKIEEQGRFSNHGHVSCIEDDCKVSADTIVDEGPWLEEEKCIMEGLN